MNRRGGVEIASPYFTDNKAAVPRAFVVFAHGIYRTSLLPQEPQNAHFA